MKKSKGSVESSFTTSSKDSKSPKPKSLTPKTKSSKSGDMKREGKGARTVKY